MIYANLATHVHREEHGSSGEKDFRVRGTKSSFRESQAMLSKADRLRLRVLVFKGRTVCD